MLNIKSLQSSSNFAQFSKIKNKLLAKILGKYLTQRAKKWGNYCFPEGLENALFK